MKSKTHKSPGGQRQQSSQASAANRAGFNARKWLIAAGCIAVVAGASFAVFEYVLPGRIPPELVGQWRVVGGPMDGTIFEFQRNGAMIGRKSLGDKEGIIEGTAEVAGTTLRTTTTNPFTKRAETGTQTIVTLTETEFVTEDAAGARVRMKRVP